jgi:lipopolysaccharide/colanic/teichoic acid biosynthesis glycosyltransferase
MPYALYRRYLKRAFDVAASALALVALAVPLLVIAWAIRRADGGPVLFADTRIGRGGRTFTCLKFRTMHVNAQQMLAQWQRTNDPLWHAYLAGNNKLKDDPRITGIGRWLRQSSLDELPQLLNVLRGEMSLVGPRPAYRRELDHYDAVSAAAYGRLTPGITGLWQVSGRSNTTFADRMALDCRYERELSPWLDARILWRTVWVVLRRDRAY